MTKFIPVEGESPISPATHTDLRKARERARKIKGGHVVITHEKEKVLPSGSTQVPGERIVQVVRRQTGS